jgi:hypothetical protein
MELALSTRIEIVTIPGPGTAKSAGKLIYSYATGGIVRLPERFLETVRIGNPEGLPRELLALLIKHEILLSRQEYEQLGEGERLQEIESRVHAVATFLGEDQRHTYYVHEPTERQVGLFQYFSFVVIPTGMLPTPVLASTLQTPLLHLLESNAREKQLIWVLDLRQSSTCQGLLAALRFLEGETRHNPYLRLVTVKVGLILPDDGWKDWEQQGLLEVLRVLTRDGSCKLLFLFACADGNQATALEREFVDFAFAHKLLHSFMESVCLLPVSSFTPIGEADTDASVFAACFAANLQPARHCSKENIAKRVLYTARNLQLIDEMLP